MSGNMPPGAAADSWRLKYDTIFPRSCRPARSQTRPAHRPWHQDRTPDGSLRAILHDLDEGSYVDPCRPGPVAEYLKRSAPRLRQGQRRAQVVMNAAGPTSCDNPSRAAPGSAFASRSKPGTPPSRSTSTRAITTHAPESGRLNGKGGLSATVHHHLAKRLSAASSSRRLSGGALIVDQTRSRPSV